MSRKSTLSTTIPLGSNAAFSPDLISSSTCLRELEYSVLAECPAVVSRMIDLRFGSIMLLAYSGPSYCTLRLRGFGPGDR